VLLLNNDAILFQQGLKTLVEYAENNSIVAGLQRTSSTFPKSTSNLRALEKWIEPSQMSLGNRAK
jgi:hypothetical protein